MLRIAEPVLQTLAAKPGWFGVRALPAKLGRRFFSREFCWFVLIGLICTFLYLAVYRFSRSSLPALGANALALGCTAGPNFTANRLLTFQAHDGSILKQAGQYVCFYVLGICASSLALATFLILWAQPPREVEYVAALGSIGLSTLIRYVALSNWVFPGSTS